MEAPILSIEAATVTYGKKVAVLEASLAVPRGECVALIGTNGSGKSSLLRSISGVQDRFSGRFLFDNSDVFRWDSRQCVEHGLILCPEGRQLFPRMSVFDNIALGAYRRAVSRQEIEGDFVALCAYFPILLERRNQDAGTLSGGEQQMVALARALMGKPKLLLLDEPSLGLSPIMTETLFSIIAQIIETGCSILIAEQNVFATLRASRYAYIMESGVISQRYQSQTVLDSPELLLGLLGRPRMQTV